MCYSLSLNGVQGLRFRLVQEARSPRQGVCSPPPACVPSAGPTEGSAIRDVTICQHLALRQCSPCKVALRLSAVKTVPQKQKLSPLDRLALASAKYRPSMRKEGPNRSEGWPCPGLCQHGCALTHEELL